VIPGWRNWVSMRCINATRIRLATANPHVEVFVRYYSYEHRDRLDLVGGVTASERSRTGMDRLLLERLNLNSPTAMISTAQHRGMRFPKARFVAEKLSNTCGQGWKNSLPPNCSCVHRFYLGRRFVVDRRGTSESHGRRRYRDRAFP